MTKKVSASSIVLRKSEYTEIIREITEVHVKVDGINRRLDISNGRIAKLEDVSGDFTEKERAENIKKVKDQLVSDKWKDRLYTLGLNAVVFTILLILVRTGIINIK